MLSPTVAKILRGAGVCPAGARAQLSWGVLACPRRLDGRLRLLHCRDALARATRRAVLPRARQPARPFRGLHREPGRALDDPAGPAAGVVTLQASETGPVPDPRPRQQVQSRLRRALPKRRRRDHPHPVSAPKANAFAERWVGTVRRECLDWLLISGRKQLERVLRIYVDHYNTHRPHRGLGLTAPIPEPRPRLVRPGPPDQIHRRDRLGGLIHEYARAA